MDLVASGRTLRRRWILTSFLFLLTLAAALAAWVKLPGPYQAESMTVLYPSQQASKPNGDNPLMSFGGSLNVAGDIVLREVSSPSYAAQLAAHGYTSSFTIVDDPNTTGPILDVTVTGKNQSQVEQTLNGVTAAVKNQLAAIQQGYKPANRITSQVVSTQPTPQLLVSKKARTVVIVLGLGLVLTFAIPQVIDAEIAKRRGVRAQRASSSSDSAAQSAGAPEEQLAEPPPADPEPQPAYQGSAASSASSASSADTQALRYGGAGARPDYAVPRTDRYQADRSDRSVTERRYSSPPPGSPRNGSAGADADHPERHPSEGTRI
jgi:hypothetical protein